MCGIPAISDLPRDLESLQSWVSKGRRVKYLFFWGHQPRPDGRLGPGCLSQWWPAAFTVDGAEYRSAEHYMMAAKARLFGDAPAEQRILAARQPAQAKALGRAVHGFNEQTWERHRFEIVVAASTAKFGQNPDLRAYLAGTAG